MTEDSDEDDGDLQMVNHVLSRPAVWARSVLVFSCATVVWWSSVLSVDEASHEAAPLLQFAIGLSYGQLVLILLI